MRVRAILCGEGASRGRGVASRACSMRRHPDGRADEGGAAVSPARALCVVREDESEDRANSAIFKVRDFACFCGLKYVPSM